MNDELASTLIDLLIDGPSSFAALHRSLIRHRVDFSSVPVGVALSRLQGLEDVGLVRASQMDAHGGGWRQPTVADRERNGRAYGRWLPLASDEDVAIDEVGLWYELTELGRRVWEEQQPPADRHSAWVLDETGSNLVSIRAETEAIAEEALRWWLAERAPKRLARLRKNARRINGFTLKDGSRVQGGVELTCTYELTQE